MTESVEATLIYVVDTNVAIVANANQSEQATPQCKLACAVRLNQIMKQERLALDNKQLIFDEYKKYLNMKGQPGVGDAFMRWILVNLATGRCVFVSIAPNQEQTGFDEFPADERLTDFDPSDRKFIAVAIAHPEKPPILQAVDLKWANFKEAFSDYGIRIEFLC